MSDLFSLNGKIALVTGSTSGMGRAIAEAMGLHGAKVVLSSNDTEGGAAAEKAFKAQGIEAFFVPCDVSKKADLDNLYAQSTAFFGKIDILVSCVGIGNAAPFLDINVSDFDKMMGVNLQSAVYLSKLVVPKMRERQDGVIIYLASIAGVRGNKNIGLYGITKAGLIQLARNLAVEYGSDNIRVNCISPGLIDTPFAQSLTNNAAFMQRRLSLTPLRRVGTVAEIAGVAVMLASRAGGFITGQNIVVDGGTTISDGN